jgi:UDP-N-acetylmuramoyl-tripeptide--D-alanyl-D-alanine ligase
MASTIPSNRCAFTLGEIAAATEGTLIGGDAGARTIGVSTDTREMQRGALFVALRGAASDGHDYLTQAAPRGAAAAVVSRGREVASLPCVAVDDTLTALGSLARRHLQGVRAKGRIPVVAVGGAAGKTTTKELLAAAARAVFGSTLATPGNLNNRIGVPMTIFTLSGEHRAAIIECGTNLRGEIGQLAHIVEPDAALVLNVDIEHSEGLGSLEEIADEEAALFSTARKFAIVSTEQPLLRSRIPPRLGVLSFGTSSDADVRLASRTVFDNGRSRITLKLNPRFVKSGESPLLVVEIGLLGLAMALNCAAAVAGVLAMSPEPLSGDGLRTIGDAFAAARPVSRRLALDNLNGVLVIDDSYNAQPPSMRAAIASATELAQNSKARLIMVLGDMLELGALAASSHDVTIGAVLASRPALFVAVGPEMTAALTRVADRPARVGGVECLRARDSEEAARLIAGRLRDGDVVLVKGSLGMAMDRVVASLRQSPP